MQKTYNVSDLFFTRWEDLTPKQHAIVYTLQQECELARRMEATDGVPAIQYGLKLIGVLRHLRKNRSLVDRINEEQAVDIYNDLTFLSKPWYYFPVINLPWAHPPDEKMSRHSFDHFIYADNEFSAYVMTNDVKHLKRLVATLYQKEFDKEAVEQLATSRIKDHYLLLVFYTFAHIRDFVMKRCKTLLPRPIPGAQSKPAPTGGMWLTLKHRLAETPAFQGYDTAGKANMYSTLDYLEDLARQKEEQRGKH